MAELLVDFITSLDGYGSAEGWPGWWGVQALEYLNWLAESPERDYMILMGANTYSLMSEMQGESPDEKDAFSELAKASKVVFSSTLQSPLAWSNIRLISGDAIEAVKQMKREGSNSMRTIGSLSLCRSLLKAGLVDRFRVVVFPVITGSSGADWIYEGYPDVALDMVASRQFDGKLQLVEYVPRVLAHPPGAQNGS